MYKKERLELREYPQLTGAEAISNVQFECESFRIDRIDYFCSSRMLDVSSISRLQHQTN